MYKRSICQIDKAWLNGRLQECVIDDETEEVIAITSENSDIAEKIAYLLNKDKKECSDNTK